MEMKMYSLTSEDLGATANTGAKIMLGQLCNDGVISKEVYDRYDRDYAIIVKPPTYFSTLWNGLIGKASEPKYVLVKQVSLRPDESQQGKE